MNNLNPSQDPETESLEKENLPYLAIASIQSEHAVKYLNVLCRHFARKVKAEWNDSQGTVYFEVGITRMRIDTKASELYIECQAKNEQSLYQQKAIINHHIALFARRESIELIWS
jgi:hypothetical protein